MVVRERPAANRGRQNREDYSNESRNNGIDSPRGVHVFLHVMLLPPVSLAGATCLAVRSLEMLSSVQSNNCANHELSVVNTIDKNCAAPIGATFIDMGGRYPNDSRSSIGSWTNGRYLPLHHQALPPHVCDPKAPGDAKSFNLLNDSMGIVFDRPALWETLIQMGEAASIPVGSQCHQRGASLITPCGRPGAFGQ
jgi:hypothetical protein